MTTKSSIKLTSSILALSLIGTGAWILFKSKIQRPSEESLLREEAIVPAEDWQPPKDWQTYRNDVFGFEMRYPPTHEVRLYDPHGKSNPAFILSAYDDTLESPVLTIDFEPTYEIGGAWVTLKRVWRLGSADIRSPVLLTDSAGRLLSKEGRHLYATCVPYSDQPAQQAVRLCNEMITTLRFVN